MPMINDMSSYETDILINLNDLCYYTKYLCKIFIPTKVEKLSYCQKCLFCKFTENSKYQVSYIYILLYSTEVSVARL